MADQPDTAAIRADLQHDRGCLKFDPFHRIIDLCDALDAARAQVAAFTAERARWFVIAERAEAKLDDVRAAATAADGMCANCHHGDLIWAILDGPPE